MGESLWPKYLDWLKDNGDSLSEVMLHSGVNGLLESFEAWLLAEGYTKYESGKYVKAKRKDGA